jgi:hypothetical protein
VRSLPRCCKTSLEVDLVSWRVRQLRVDNWSNELGVRQMPAGKNMSTEAEDIVGIRHQATTGEDTAG